ncbi:serine hydrolase domain-containing protein [Cohnella pontilimi]|nr:serine hydrolase domain-containing protein [Cohnella pontilimi]
MSDHQRIKEKLNRVLAEFVEQEPVTGLSVGIIYDNKMLYAKGFGVKNIETGEAVNETTLYHMASVSKTLVAAGIMRLVELGKITLDDYVVDHLPYFTLSDGQYRKITIRQLLTHTSGLPDEDEFEWDRPQYDELSLERYVKSVKDRHLLWEPGTNFYYSNIGYEILGDLIAKVTGVSFEQYMRENILLPSGMRDGTFLKQEASDTSLATPHVLGIENGYGGRVSDVFPYNRAHGPSSTLYANAIDMCSYAIAQLKQEVLSADCYDLMWRKYADTGYGPEMEGIGLSWFLGEYKGLRLVSHAGRDTGFRSHLVILPDKGIAVCVMTNSDYQGLKVVWQSVLDFLLGEEVPYIKKSLAHDLAGWTMSHGIEAAAERFRSIQPSQLDRYLVSEPELQFIADTLFERGARQESEQLRELSYRIFGEQH